MSKISKIVLLCASAFLLSACGPSLEDARKAGFQSVEEMKQYKERGFNTMREFEAAQAEDIKRSGFASLEEMNTFRARGFKTKADFTTLGFKDFDEMDAFRKRGYASMAEYKAVKAMTPDVFYRSCKEASRSAYDANCKGKRVSWRGVVDSIGSDGATITLLNDDGTEPAERVRVDSKSVAADIDRSVIGRMIEFEGVIDRQNVLKPDIERAVVLSIESEGARAVREKEQARVAEIRKREEARKAEERRREENQQRLAELKPHLEDAAWLANKFDVESTMACKPAVERLAKFNFEWFDSWSEMKFPSFYTKTRGPGVFVVTGEKIKFQNGFGAWQIMKYECAYDAVNRRVVSADASPR